MPKALPHIRQRHDSWQWPPLIEDQFETAEESARQAEKAREARIISDKIDQALSAERQGKKKGPVKILILGQSESGKSTTLRNFQLNLAPKAFQADAEAWRSIIHLNLLMSVNYLLEVLKTSYCPSSPGNELRSPYYAPTPSSQLIEREKQRLRALDGSFNRSTTQFSDGRASPSQYSSELRRLMLSLLPLKSIETTLRQRLGAESLAPQSPESPGNPLLKIWGKNLKAKACSLDIQTTPVEPFVRPSSALSFSSSTLSSENRSRRLLGFRRHSVSSSATSSASSSAPGSVYTSGSERSIGSASTYVSSSLSRESSRNRRKLSDFVDSFAVRVRGSTGWKRRARLPDHLTISKRDEPHNDRNSIVSYSHRPSLEFMSEQEERELLAARQILQVFGEDIDQLWRNEEVQKTLKRLNIRLESKPGFFLNDVIRITAYDYVPTTCDILRARLSTSGVEEHRLVLEVGPEAGKEWIIYDVGGFRSQRAAWAPFFDSVNAIIFLAPISAFDEYLAEDPNVNRLEDTFNLWMDICKNRLLISVEFILFLNKYDVLKAKIRAGSRFSNYVLNYNDENRTKNNPECIARYMLATFNAAHKKLSPRPRRLRTYLTSVIDSRATAKVVNHISEQVLIGHLISSDVL